MKIKNTIRWILVGVLAVIGVAIIVNYEWICDYVKGIIYSPTSEMMAIRDKLNLTDKGEFLFNASRPVLSEREDFNEVCRYDNDNKTAVLGCYTDGNIYIYNIEDERLNGILELTTAHELLHANWARMSETERVELTRALTQVFDANQVILSEEIDAYDNDVKQEELYVRAGTEVMNLPDELEEHYAKVFKDQDAVVEFYNNYIAVFKELKAEMEQLKKEIEVIDSEIAQMTSEYESGLKQYEADVVSFNNCANIEGCFKSQGEFDIERSRLLYNREDLENKYNKISEVIEKYNSLVEKYNDDVVKNNELNKKINSNSVPEEVK